MYLILFPTARQFCQEKPDQTLFESLFTTDMHRVSEALKIDSAQVYSLTGMTRIRDVKVTYEEITQEMIDG